MKPSESQRSRKAGNDQRGKENAALLARIDKVFAAMFRQQSYPPGKRFMTIRELIVLVSGERREDQISESSMRRVLDVMRDTFNLPVDFIPERKGHGFTEPVASFSLDAVSEDQVYALIQSVQMLRTHRDSRALQQLRRVVKKACFGITLKLGVEFEEIERALSFHLIGFDAPAPVDPGLFKAAMRAILQKQEVEVEHRSVKRRGEVRLKTVEPLHLAMINHGLYLFHYQSEARPGVATTAGPANPARLPGEENVAGEAIPAAPRLGSDGPMAGAGRTGMDAAGLRDGQSDGSGIDRDEVTAANAAAVTKDGAARSTLRKGDGIRKFALARIGSLAPTGRRCKARKFDVHERVRRGMGAFDDDDAMEVELRFSPKVAGLILERPWHPEQVVTEQADGGLVMRLRVAHSPELEGAVLRWAGDVEVVGPELLRKRMRQLGEALVAAHG